MIDGQTLRTIAVNNQKDGRGRPRLESVLTEEPWIKRFQSSGVARHRSKNR
jgi:hypothetical protein